LRERLLPLPIVVVFIAMVFSVIALDSAVLSCCATTDES